MRALIPVSYNSAVVPCKQQFDVPSHPPLMHLGIGLIVELNGVFTAGAQ